MTLTHCTDIRNEMAAKKVLQLPAKLISAQAKIYHFVNYTTCNAKGGRTINPAVVVVAMRDI